MLAKRGQDVLIEPALVPELDREPAVARQKGEKTREPVDVLLHVRRELEQDRPEAAA